MLQSITINYNQLQSRNTTSTPNYVYRFPKTKRVELGFGTGCRDQLIGLDSGKTKVGPEPKGSEFTLFTTPKDSEPLARGDSLDCVKRIDDTPKGGGGKPCPPRSNLISNVGERKWMFWFLPCYACFTCFCMCLMTGTVMGITTKIHKPTFCLATALMLVRDVLIPRLGTGLTHCYIPESNIKKWDASLMRGIRRCLGTSKPIHPAAIPAILGRDNIATVYSTYNTADAELAREHGRATRVP
jgi:hypothetical protein